MDSKRQEILKKREKKKRNKIAETTNPNQTRSSLGLRGEGQVITPRNRVSASKIWCFALFPDTLGDIGPIVRVLSQCGEFFCEEEHCPETERLHLQGWIKFKKPCRPMEKIKFFGRWVKTKGSWEQNYAYCTKEGGQTYTNMDILEPVLDPMLGLQDYWWEKDIRNMISMPADSRSIYWYYDPPGKGGKTTFAKHLCLIDKHIVFVNGKANDVKCFIEKMIKKKITPHVIIFYFERDSIKEVDYTAIKCVKDGIFFSGKYDSNMTIYNPPHVICFSNWEPKTNKLSQDRWKIYNINKGGELYICAPKVEKIIHMDDNNFG